MMIGVSCSDYGFVPVHCARKRYPCGNSSMRVHGKTAFNEKVLTLRRVPKLRGYAV